MEIIKRAQRKLAALVSSLLLVASPPATTLANEAPLPLTEPAPAELVFTAKGSLISWQKNLNAVAYEVEVFREAVGGGKLDNALNDPRAAFRSTQVYDHVYELPIDELAPPASRPQRLYWRVRALGLERRPLSPFSELAAIDVDENAAPLEAPLPIVTPVSERGAAMLYPVYNWVRPRNAASFVVQVYEESPESGAEPVAEIDSTMAELYDPTPRIGQYWWRVRSLDADGNALGEWSRFVFVQTSRRVYKIAAYGDSVTHGGGHISYGPGELAYSWLHYLDFDALNLAQSGDTTAAMLERFEDDVLPFAPKYLLIMGGVNDLRSDEFTAESVIANLEEIRTKCLRHDIKPILLTLPPVNPANIARAFGEETDPRWREKFALVNNYIRTRVHIDAAQLFPDDAMPESLALDGLHPDIPGKRLIAQAVNENWRRARKLADRTFVMAK